MMRKLTLDEWEKKYMVGPVEQLNQKNTMVDRIDTDPEFFKQATHFGGIFAFNNIFGHFSYFDTDLLA